MVRMLCESTSGNICKLLIYDGSGMNLEGTIFHLLSPYLGLGYQVFMDNYYNSVKLSQKLYEQKTTTCGTIRVNRGFPADLKEQQKKLGKGEMTFRRHDNVLMLTWMDKRAISMVSTIHSASMVEVTDRYGNTLKSY